MWVTFKENREKHKFDRGELSSWSRVPNVLFWEHEPETCNRCDGSGIILYQDKKQVHHHGIFSSETYEVPTIEEVSCYRCYSTGWVAKERDNPTTKETEDARQKDT